MKTIVMPSFAGGSSHAYFGSALRESRADGVAVAEGTCAWQALRGLGVGTRAEGKGGGASRILVNSGMLSYGMHAHLDHFLCWRCRCGRYVFATKLATERQKKVLIAPELEQAEGMFGHSSASVGGFPSGHDPVEGRRERLGYRLSPRVFQIDVLMLKRRNPYIIGAGARASWRQRSWRLNDNSRALTGAGARAGWR